MLLIEFLCLQLCLGACLLAAGASLLAAGAFCLAPKRTVNKEAQLREKEVSRL